LRAVNKGEAGPSLTEGGSGERLEEGGAVRKIFGGGAKERREKGNEFKKRGAKAMVKKNLTAKGCNLKHDGGEKKKEELCLGAQKRLKN